jgi:hypothetical protein
MIASRGHQLLLGLFPANPSWRGQVAEATIPDVDAAIDQNKKEPADALV